MTEIVAVIPARGGSKGVPRKNVRRVGGVPLVARAIAAARATASIDRVVVSTDDQEIAAIAQEWGAQVIARPAALAGDEASSESASCCTRSMLSKTAGVEASILVFLQPTSPFIDTAGPRRRHRPRPGERARQRLLRNRDIRVPVGRAMPAARGGVNHDPSVRPRRQDREPQYLETGAFYVMDAAGFRAARPPVLRPGGLVEVAERTAIEIDSEEHLAMAQAIAPLRARTPTRWMSPPW